MDYKKEENIETRIIKCKEEGVPFMLVTLSMNKISGLLIGYYSLIDIVTGLPATLIRGALPVTS